MRGRRGDRGAAAQPAGPVAVYARVLDGDTLWLAVTGTEGKLALRHLETGRVTPMGSDLPDDPGVRSIRTNLTAGLPPSTTPVVFEVVALEARGTRPVRIDRLPQLHPIRTPPSRDGRWQFDVRRADDGVLRIRRDPAGVAAYVIGAEPIDDDLLLTLTDPGAPPDAALLFVADPGGPLAATPLVRSGGSLQARITPEHPPTRVGLTTMLYVGTTSEPTLIPVVRSHNDLVAPGTSVLLPTLIDSSGAAGPLIRFHYQGQGRIIVRRPAESAEYAGGADDEGGDD